MGKALKKDPKIMYASDIAWHHAAECPSDAVRWLPVKGIPCSARYVDDLVPGDLARMGGNEESQKVLREWAVRKGEVVHIGYDVHAYVRAKYELYYKTNRYEDHPDRDKPFSTLCMGNVYRNDLFCQSQVSQRTRSHRCVTQMEPAS